MDLIVENIKYLRKHFKGLTQHEISDKIAVSRSRYASYETGRIEVPIDVLIRLSKFYNVTIDVMLKVDLTTVSLEHLMKLDNNRILLPLKMDNEGNDNYIELIPQRASAGYLEGYADAEYIENMDSFTLPFLTTGKHRAFQIQGDSMLPLESGSFVVGKLVERMADLKKGKTYVVLTRNEGCTYKRIIPHPRKKTLEMIPDNPLFEKFEVPYHDVLEMWEFACSIGTSDYKNQ
jgi:transcriptional regulator with XRE-family HTH domain